MLYFIKKSWLKDNWDRAEYALNHEQRHFDITEVYARKATAAFKEYKYNRKTVKDDINRIFNSFLEEQYKVQLLYDKETKHSLNISKQKEWDAKIDKWLQEYEN